MERREQGADEIYAMVKAREESGLGNTGNRANR